MVTREQPLTRDAFAIWRRIGTRWADNDAYGHVNNAVYYGWFDTAVNAWLVEQELLDVAASSLIGLVVATSCSYFKPLSFPQDVELGLAAERIGTSSVVYRVGAFEVGGDHACAQGRFTHVYVDRATRRPVALPPIWKERLNNIGR